MSLFSYIIYPIFVLSKQLQPMKLYKLHIILFTLILSVSSLCGQGFENIFGGNSADFGEAIVYTPNGGYVLAGFSESFGNDNDLDVYVIRTDVDGQVMWEYVYDEGFTEHGYTMINTPDGGFLIAGDRRATQTSTTNAYLIKLDANGQLIWSKEYGDEDHHQQAFSIIPSIDGGYLLLGRAENIETNDLDIYLVAIDNDGAVVWEQSYGDDNKQEGFDLAIYQDGYVLAGKTYNDANDSNDAYIARIDGSGTLLWEQAYGSMETDIAYTVAATNDNHIVFGGLTGFNSNVYLSKIDATGEVVWSKSFGGVLGDEAHDLLETSDGDLVIAGISEQSASNIDLFLTKVNSSGNILWERTLGSPSNTEIAPALTATPTGYALCSSSAPFDIDLVPDVYLVTTDQEGNLNSTRILGAVFSDIDNNCQSTNIVDEPLEGWLVKATSENNTYYTTTDVEGNYEMLVDTGRYNVSVLMQNDYWKPCIDDYNVNLSQLYDTLILNFPIDANTVCPFLQVDIAAASLSNCDDVTYTVEYCNTGTTTAIDAYVEVIIDDLIAINQTSIPVANTIDSTYRFDLGNIDIGTCQSFTINAIIDCQGFITGEAHRVSAHIYPDDLCDEPDESWDGSSVALKGACTTDSIKFELKNIGSNPMEDSLQYFVVEDQVIFLKDSFKLDASESYPVSFPANGSTWRMIAAQSKGHPGQSYPTVVVEGCANGDGEAISTGFVTAFPEDENDPFISIDIIENIPFTEATQLRGYPRGYGDDKIVPSTTDLEYQIRFQNLGNDTINSVVIRDTLSSLLDLATIQPGASSHPYFFEIYGNGVLKFTFFDLKMPPSGGLETTDTQGFVAFKVAQQPNNPTNSVIENRAAVYLDYDQPRLTNTVFHTVGDDDLTTYVEISTSTEEVFVPGTEVNIYPNPFTESATIEIKGISIHNGLLEIFDNLGRKVQTKRFNGNRVAVQRKDIASGLYFYQLYGDKRRINIGKIFVQ